MSLRIFNEAPTAFRERIQSCVLIAGPPSVPSTSLPFSRHAPERLFVYRELRVIRIQLDGVSLESIFDLAWGESV